MSNVVVAISTDGLLSRLRGDWWNTFTVVETAAFDVCVCVQMQMQEVMRDNTALKRRIEAMEADVQRRSDTDRDKFSVLVSDCASVFSDTWQLAN